MFPLMSCIFFGGACLKYNNLPLGPIQPWSPSTKELHEYTRWHLICFQCGKGGGAESITSPQNLQSQIIFRNRSKISRDLIFAKWNESYYCFRRFKCLYHFRTSFLYFWVLFEHLSFILEPFLPLLLLCSIPIFRQKQLFALTEDRTRGSA